MTQFSVQKEDFFRVYKEKDCVKLDHVTSHTDFCDKFALSLDMICRVKSWYHLVSFVTAQVTVIRVRINNIKIVKIEYNFTLITFRRERQGGLASLFFELVEDAKSFNNNVYGPLLERLKVTCTLSLLLRTIIGYPHTCTILYHGRTKYT